MKIFYLFIFLFCSCLSSFGQVLTYKQLYDGTSNYKKFIDVLIQKDFVFEKNSDDGDGMETDWFRPLSTINLSGNYRIGVSYFPKDESSEECTITINLGGESQTSKYNPFKLKLDSSCERRTPVKSTISDHKGVELTVYQTPFYCNGVMFTFSQFIIKDELYWMFVVNSD